jgi:putative secretion ATPase (PEP-CTERM system associated)
MTYLDYGIKEKTGFMLLTGEIGSGKTTIVRNLIKSLNSAVKLSQVNNTKVSSEQLISMINEDFGMDVKGKEKTVLLSELNEFLIDQYARGLQPILLIDEAQNLTPDLLEEIRLLSNLETDRSKLLQIILVGQPELKKTLMLPGLVQLRQRITVNYHIIPLTVDETAKYIKHRLTVAGNPDVIDVKKDMVGLIYQFSRGIPRLINILCDFALLTTYVEGEKVVSSDTIKEVISDLETHNYWNSPEITVSGELPKETGLESLKVTGEITGKLSKLEETISQITKNTSNDIRVLSEKVTKLENNFLKTNGNRDNSKITELLKRVASLEKAPVIVNTKKPPESLWIDDDKPVAEQVEFLKRLLTYVNNKLRKL